MRFSLLLLYAAFVSSAKIDLTANTRSHNKVVTCYVASWAAYRPEKGAFTVDNIDPTLCTHIIYTFAGLNNVTYTIHSMDPFLDTTDGGGRGQYKKLVDMKNNHSNLKVLIAIGGWNEGSQKYSDMASSPEHRKTFIESVVTFLKKHRFDGLDLDWEYPGSRSTRTLEDRDNFSLLVKELRKEFDKTGLLLTAAVGAAISTINKGYDIPEISRHLDYIHVMGYDYHGSWEGQVGHNAPLRLPGNSSNLIPELRLSVEDTMQHYIKLGAPRSKLVLGVPFYGRTFILTDKRLRDLGSPAQGSGFQGPYTREDGFLGFNEICKEVLTESWEELWDEVSQTPYMYKEDKFVAFDNSSSIAMKTRYAYDEKLAGVMIWAIDNDDFMAECSNIRYPLLRTINSALKAAVDGDSLDNKGIIIPPREPEVSGTSSNNYSFTMLYMFASVMILFNQYFR